MLKKRLFGLTVLIVGIMMAFTLAGCGDDSSGDPSTPPGGGTTPGYTSGWPSSAVLTEFKLSGLAKPATATEEEYYVNPGRNFLSINFKNTKAEKSIDDCFLTNGWKSDPSSYGNEFDGDEIMWWYVNDTNEDEGSYDWRPITGSSSISVVLDQP